MKKFISLLILGVMTFSSVAFSYSGDLELIVNTGEFSDISGDDFEILYLIDRGVVKGNPDGTISPDKALNRAEALVLFARMFNIVEAYDSNCTYPDVKESDWYAGYVSAMCNAGLVTGNDDGLFHADRQLNRAEAMAILYRGLGVSVEKPYNFLSDDVAEDVWYAPYAEYVLKTNIVNLYKDRGEYDEFTADLAYTRRDLFENLYRSMRMQDMGAYVYHFYDDDVFVVDNIELKDSYLALSENKKNPILEAKAKILENKYNGDVSNVDDFIEWVNYTSGLKVNLNNGFNARRADLSLDLDLLTGQRAIEESLQLGSITSSEFDSVDLVNIDTINALEIPSHPWEEMIEGRDFEVPELASLAPKDDLFVYITNPDAALELENVMNELINNFGFDLYSLGEMTEMRARLLEDLSLANNDVIIPGLSEMGFISEDIAFMPATDFALIMKFKTDLLKNAFEVLSVDAIKQDIGDYTVVATSQNLLDKIAETYADKTLSMAEEKDFHFALSELEERRDGMIYASEAFIRKMTSPEYRINAERRNAVIDALQAMQYSVFAYRSITGEWPESFEQMGEEGYIDLDVISFLEDYSIAENGIVNHKDWGNMWKVNPVNRVDISMISQGEKENYESFYGGYQSFFTRFFDPIGIAFTVSDQISFHTLILPLIEDSDYNLLRAIFVSTERPEFNSMFNFHRQGLFNISSGFNFDRFLLEMDWGSNPETMTEEEKLAHILEMEAAFAEEFEMEIVEGERLFDFIGDEISFGFGEYGVVDTDEEYSIDAWLGLKILDQEKAEVFLVDFLKKVEEELEEEVLFRLDTVDYNGLQYSVFPVDEFNFYYAFIEDRFYIAGNEDAMKKLIDNFVNENEDELNNVSRALAYTGINHQVLFVVNFSKLLEVSSYEDLFAYIFGFDNSKIRNSFENRKNYLLEAMSLAKILDGYDGTYNNVRYYYAYIPEEFMGGTFSSESGEVYFQLGTEKENIKDITADYNYYYDDADSEGINVIDMLDYTFDFDFLVEKLVSYESGALGLSLTEDGLEVKISFGNPYVDEIDDRFDFVRP